MESFSVPGLEDVTDWPCLTILYHPDLQRIGERAIVGGLLTGHPVEISRNHPSFVHPGADAPRSLRDRYVSRKPARLRLLDDNHTIEVRADPGTHLRVDGQQVARPIKLPRSALEPGVLLEVARRVVVIFHTVSLGERTASMGLVGESEGIRRVRQQIARVADLDVPVLIRGETGVGKERVAQSIHAASQRSAKPCIAVNMAAITPTTAVSELFGHVKGSFTGALSGHLGLFQRADGGTLFLDEIGETPPNIQAMLLRTLAEGTVLAVGDQSERPVDARIIAATDANIEDGGQDGSFRAALFHRLSGYEIRVPPLRERRDDIGRLALHFLTNELEKTGEMGRLESNGATRVPWFPPALMVRLYHHVWPGNVRQLSNVIRHLVISSRGSDTLHVDEGVERALLEGPMAKSRLVGESYRASSRAELVDDADATNDPPQPTSDDDLVYSAMKASGWNIAAAAKRLGVPRTTLYNVISKHPRLRMAKDIPRNELENCLRVHDFNLERTARALEITTRSLQLRLTQLAIPWKL